MTEREAHGLHILDFAALCSELFDEHISDHDSTAKHWPELVVKANEVRDALGEFYQFAGRTIIEEISEDIIAVEEGGDA